MTFEKWTEAVNDLLVGMTKSAAIPGFKQGGYELDSVGIMHGADKYSAHWSRDSRWVDLSFHGFDSDIPPVWLHFLRPPSGDEMRGEMGYGVPLIVVRRPPSRDDRLLHLTLEDAKRVANTIFRYLVESNLPDEAPDGSP